MKAFFLIAIFFLLPFELWAMCLDKKIDPKVEKQVREAAKYILDPKNETVVPPGLPEGKYPVRSVETKAMINGNALVFITFSEQYGDHGFVSPYTFVRNTKTLEKINIPDLGNNDSRFWDVKTKILSKCKNPEIQITYDACSECGAGNDLILTIHFFALILRK